MIANRETRLVVKSIRRIIYEEDGFNSDTGNYGLW